MSVFGSLAPPAPLHQLNDTLPTRRQCDSLHGYQVAHLQACTGLLALWSTAARDSSYGWFKDKSFSILEPACRCTIAQLCSGLTRDKDFPAPGGKRFIPSNAGSWRSSSGMGYDAGVGSETRTTGDGDEFFPIVQASPRRSPSYPGQNVEEASPEEKTSRSDDATRDCRRECVPVPQDDPYSPPRKEKDAPQSRSVGKGSGSLHSNLLGGRLLHG